MEMQGLDRLLVIGGSSLLGSKILDVGQRRYGADRCFSSHNRNNGGGSADRVDIGSEGEVRRLFEKVRPEVVICAAAMTNVDDCERYPELAKKINSDGPRNVSLSCKKFDSKLIHVSTDYVFDGEKNGRYTEDDDPNPISVYGRSKLDGDSHVLSVLPDAVIARPAVLYGWNNTVRKENFVTWVIGKLRDNQAVPLFEDQYTSPTFADDLARTLLDLSEKEVSGIWNVSGPDCLNRPECGRKIAEVFKLDASLISPVPMASVNLPAKRPRRTCLDVSKVERLLKRKTLSFEDGINAMKEQEASIR